MLGGVDRGSYAEFVVVKPSEAAPKPARLSYIEAGRLIDQGKIRPVVMATYPPADARQANERLERGHVRGKIVPRRDRAAVGHRWSPRAQKSRKLLTAVKDRPIPVR